ncbi:MAG: hypothetical protein PVJ19_18480, partial [Desulfobacteraceae bacterium]
MNRILSYFFTMIFLFTSHAVADTSKYIDTYGQLPKYRSLAISPNGKYFSYIERGREHDLFIVRHTETRKTAFAGNITKFKARSTSFVTDKHVLLRGSDTMYVWGYNNRHEHSAALAYNIETGKFKLLLKGTKNIHPAQSGLGEIVGMNAEDETVYMPAFASGSNHYLNLYNVSLNSGKGRLHAKG